MGPEYAVTRNLLKIHSAPAYKATNLGSIRAQSHNYHITKRDSGSICLLGAFLEISFKRLKQVLGGNATQVAANMATAANCVRRIYCG